MAVKQTKNRPIHIILLVALLLGGGVPQQTSTRAAPPQAIQAPVLKWQHGGRYSSRCETGWYSSPAVADLDGDGTRGVIGSVFGGFHGGVIVAAAAFAVIRVELVPCNSLWLEQLL